MGLKFWDREENIVRKGDIACNKQFLLFSQCFLHSYIPIVRQNVALCGNGKDQLKLID